MMWLLPSPPPPSASCLSLSVFLCVAGRTYWRGRERERWGKGEGAKSYDGEKALSSITHKTLSGLHENSEAHLTICILMPRGFEIGTVLSNHCFSCAFPFAHQKCSCISLITTSYMYWRKGWTRGLVFQLFLYCQALLINFRYDDTFILQIIFLQLAIKIWTSIHSASKVTRPVWYIYSRYSDADIFWK